MNDGRLTDVLRTKLPLLIVCFLVVACGSWMLLRAYAPRAYLSAGVIELGYFNPRDYLPHPVLSTRGISAWVCDPSFSQRVTEEIEAGEGNEGKQIQIIAAPLEEGLLRIEARAATSGLAKRAASMACSLVVSAGNMGFERETSMISRQLDMIEKRAALAESLIYKAEKGEEKGALLGGAVRALAHLTEIQIDTETEAELIAQKKRTKLIVAPSFGIQERPPLLLLSFGPAVVITAFFFTALIAGTSRRREEQ